jgi:hypothetical protein
LIEPASIGTLLRRAGRLILRRWPLYAIGTLVAVAIQFGLLFAPGISPEVAGVVGEVFAYAPLTAIVFGFGAADYVAEAVEPAAIWGRIAERVWAVVVLDAAINLLYIAVAFGVGAAPVAQVVGETGVLILITLLAFAETHAIVAPDEKPARLLADSLLASVRITTTRIGYGRAVAVVLLPFLILLLVPRSWSVAVSALLTVPVAALTVVFYLDCLTLAGSRTK